MVIKDFDSVMNKMAQILELNKVKKKIKVTSKIYKKESKRKYMSYKFIYEKQHKLVILLAIFNLPKNKDRIQSITVEADGKYDIPIALQIKSIKGYDFIIYQNENQLIVDSSVSNRKQSKVYNLKDAQRIIKEIINI